MTLTIIALNTVMLSVVMLSVIMLSVVAPWKGIQKSYTCFIQLNESFEKTRCLCNFQLQIILTSWLFLMLSVIMLSVIMLSVIMLSVIMLSVIMLTVSLCWVSLCWVSLCWVSLCWMSFMLSVVDKPTILSVILSNNDLRSVIDIHFYEILSTPPLILKHLRFSFN